ncbi:MAG: MarR family transcriptional regulator [Bacteroidota bacterium]
MTMSLEQDIAQSQFTSAYQKALINLMYTNNHVVDRMNQTFKEYEITRQQYNVLRILRGQAPSPATINLIKDRMIDRQSDASRIVERLRLKGLIERRQNDDDRRAVEVSITKDGLALLDSMDGDVEGFESMFMGLTPEEAHTLNVLLDKVRF